MKQITYLPFFFFIFFSTRRFLDIMKIKKYGIYWFNLCEINNLRITNIMRANSEHNVNRVFNVSITF